MREEIPVALEDVEFLCRGFLDIDSERPGAGRSCRILRREV
jgi:hypothetical protein